VLPFNALNLLKVPISEMIIRHIKENELADLLGLYALLHPDDPRIDAASDRIKLLWENIQANQNLRYYVAEVEGKLTSTCTLAIIPNLTRDARPYGIIENVFTLPELRKRGIATKVLHKALDEAWDANCYKVMLLTGRKDEDILRFYEKAGFIKGMKTGFIAYPPKDEK
jgi:GNAT superfamily N-acetyltransferase